jgi:hypothetical protein
MDSEPPPPWIAMPALSPDDPANQGAGEAYIVLEFLPYWCGLSVAQKAAYLDRWNASPQWREVIAERYDSDLDIEADAEDAAAWAEAQGKPRKRFWWPFGR